MSEDLLGRYTIETPPFLRQLAMDSFAAVPEGHPMTAFMELDVTEPLESIEARKREGVRVSLFAHVVRSIAVALSEHRELNVVRHGRRIAYFEDVDVNIPVEVQTAEGKFPLQIVIRRAQDKGAGAIYDEIASARERYATEGATGAEDRWARTMMRVERWVPRLLRLFLIRRMIANARLVKQRSGTTLVTSVGKFASIPGFVTPFASGPRAVTFALGSVVDKPRVKDGCIAIRSVLALTAIFEHDLVDGAPAARFASRLRDLVEGPLDLGPGPTADDDP
ncbi:MAG: 2-oxo acid dehydrogenase subunit E2 [Sandaracinaceae bacterium]|nr:2-oxo acid dehydrogenase subunit E2 [Sandaracinaceae bacterium]